MNSDKPDRALVKQIQQAERLCYGKYRGIVVSNDDPDRLGRLTLRVPKVFGPNVVTGWALPCIPYGGGRNRGFLYIPEPNDLVWVEFEAGDPELPIWTGTIWSNPDGDSEVPRPNNADGSEQELVQRPLTRKIIKTHRGHTIQFEDADAEERIIICDGDRTNRIVFAANSLSIVHKDNTITMTDQEITINGAQRVCLEGLITWLMNHTHASQDSKPTEAVELATVLQDPDGEILSQRVTLG